MMISSPTEDVRLDDRTGVPAAERDRTCTRQDCVLGWLLQLWRLSVTELSVEVGSPALERFVVEDRAGVFFTERRARRKTAEPDVGGAFGNKARQQITVTELSLLAVTPTLELIVLQD